MAVLAAVSAVVGGCGLTSSKTIGSTSTATPVVTVISTATETVALETETEPDAATAPPPTTGSVQAVQRRARVTVARVRRVVDGDTIRTTNGVVRLLQVDAPEPGTCFALNSKRSLQQLAPKGTLVRLAQDPVLDLRDDRGRSLRYVFVGRKLVNSAMVRRGAAAPYFRDGERGVHADRLLAAGRMARRLRRGLWRQCAATPFRPTRQLATRR